ncbi:efflux RND transporter permease subunit [Bythopirellula goksoeyrii]|uniref:MMPL family protein n=1 Tax=Bythopirellula goksoeyrii TaxID=1400387 RepID=A0A5B9QDG0_9BACT|nr:MMPL family transporter [Bythopirellula goksoeyrii]QEG34976.1 MMPL family protein [Bythopirellula goksoeyrii]
MGFSFFLRHRDAVLLLVLLVYPFVVWKALEAFQGGSTNTDDWLPESFAETNDLRWFQKHFVSDDLLVVSWDGFTLEDPRATELADLLSSPIDVGDGERIVLTRKVMTPQDVIAQLQAEPLSLSRREAEKRLCGWLTCDQSTTGCLLVLMSEEGWPYRDEVVQTIEQWAQQEKSLTKNDLHLAGLTLDSMAIDEASNRHMAAMMLGSYGLSILLMVLLFRSVGLAVIVFFDALFCQQLSLAVITLSGTQMDSVLLIVPSLVYVLAVSTCVHVLNYYRDSLREVSLEDAPAQAMRHALVPCLLSTTTTGIGLISLMVSSLVPVDKFAFFGTVGLLLSTGILFILLPCQLSWLGPRLKLLPEDPDESPPQSTAWTTLQNIVQRLRWPILVATVIAFIVSGWGISQLQTSARVYDLFTHDSRIIQDYDWFEENIGPLVPLEIVLRMPNAEAGSSAPGMLDKLRLVATIARLVDNHPQIGAVISAATFAPPIERKSRRPFQVARETFINNQLENFRTEFAQNGFFAEAPNEELWRISARTYAGSIFKFSEVMNSLSNELDPLLEKASALGFKNTSLVYCGGVPLVQKTQRQMLVDLKAGFLSAAWLISVVMVLLAFVHLWPAWREATSPLQRGQIGIKSLLAGGVSMISNLLPCAIIFGAMGLIHVRVDIGSLLTASVALGIAVDDTLHFLSWFRRGLSQGSDRREAVALAYRQCGLAMLETTLICGLGLLVYALSPFVPIARFAWLMFAMLSVALVGDLVVLPALLLGRTGGFFQADKLPSPETDNS